MKVTNGEIYGTKDSLQKLVDVQDMPIKHGFKILKLARKLNDEINLVEQAKNMLIKKYGDEVDGKISLSPMSEKFPEFVSEMNEMMAVETELDVEKAKVPDNVTLGIKDLAALEPFIEVVDEKA